MTNEQIEAAAKVLAEMIPAYNPTGGRMRIAERMLEAAERAAPAVGDLPARLRRASIRDHGEAWVERLRHEAADLLEAQAAEIEQLQRLVYVPGLWHCAKCEFQLSQANLNAADGSVTARDQPGDKCPNCNSPLWRVTERKAGNDMVDRCEEQIGRAVKAEVEIARLTEALSAARASAIEDAAKVAEAVDLPSAT